MADLTRIGKNNQKRDTSISVCDSTTATEANGLYNIPAKSLLLTVNVIVTVPEASATIDIYIDGTLAVDEVSLTAAGSTGNSLIAQVYYPVGGLVEVRPGTTAPTTGEVSVICRYIEVDKVTGELTDV